MRYINCNLHQYKLYWSVYVENESNSRTRFRSQGNSALICEKGPQSHCVVFMRDIWMFVFMIGALENEHFSLRFYFALCSDGLYGLSDFVAIPEVIVLERL